MDPTPEPTRQAVDSLPGLTLLEFGASWCGHCQRAKPHVDAAVKARPGLRHIRVEDSSGKPLGRSFRVTLWPTLVLLDEGVEKARVVRPRGPAEIEALFAN